MGELTHPGSEPHKLIIIIIIISYRVEPYRSIPFITPLYIPFLIKMNGGAAYSTLIACLMNTKAFSVLF